MDEDYSKGQRLFIETTVGTVEGIFHSMDPGHNKLTLNKVVLHPSGKEVQGLYHYYRNEVISIRILEPGSYTGVKNEAAGNWNLMQTVDPLVRIDKIPGKVTESDVVMNHIPRYSHSNRAAMNKSKLSAEEYDVLNKLIQNHVLIDHLGDVFKEAVREIKAEPTVGLSVEGAMFGRYSKVSLISITTPSCAFIFDIFTLGDAAFDNGLRDILETEEIKKVIHNCRLVSDCLHHKHHVTICSVFDTQVADLMVTQQQCGQFPRTVHSLPQCLRIYLHLPDSLIYHPQTRAGYIVMDSLMWNKRPLSVELLVAAVKNSIFLLQLHKKILEKLMRPFYQCVDVFLRVVRDADQDEVNEHQANDACVPLQLLSLSVQPRMEVYDPKT